MELPSFMEDMENDYKNTVGSLFDAAGGSADVPYSGWFLDADDTEFTVDVPTETLKPGQQSSVEDETDRQELQAKLTLVEAEAARGRTWLKRKIAALNEKQRKLESANRQLSSSVAGLERKLQAAKCTESKLRKELGEARENFDLQKRELEDEFHQRHETLCIREAATAEEDTRIQQQLIDFREKLSAVKMENQSLIETLKQYEVTNKKAKKLNAHFLKELKKLMSSRILEIRKMYGTKCASSNCACYKEVIRLKAETSSLKKSLDRWTKLIPRALLSEAELAVLENQNAFFRESIENYIIKNSELKALLSQMDPEFQSGSVQLLVEQQLSQLTDRCRELADLKKLIVSLYCDGSIADHSEMNDMTDSYLQSESKSVSQLLAETDAASPVGVTMIRRHSHSSPVAPDSFSKQSVAISPPVAQTFEIPPEEVGYAVLNETSEKEGEPMGDGSFKILHVVENPAKIATMQYEQTIENIIKENVQLKIRLKEYERMRQELRQAKTTNADACANEPHVDDDITGRVEQDLRCISLETRNRDLVREVERLRSQLAKVEAIYTKTTKTYREVCALLTGFQCKMKGDSFFVLQSMLERSGKQFIFRKTSDNRLELIENEYTMEWEDLIRKYLLTNDSIPAFLAAVTLHLFARNSSVWQ